jgi:hypothetical protein
MVQLQLGSRAGCATQRGPFAAATSAGCPRPQRRWAAPLAAVRSGEAQQAAPRAAEPLDLASLPLVPEQLRLAAGQHVSLQSALLWAGCAALFLTAGHAQAADGLHEHASHAVPLLDVAESEDFWDNVLRYARFFVTVMLGTVNVMVRPFAGLLKKPVTAVVAIASLVGGVVLLKMTLELMLGMGDQQFDYLPMDSTSY